MLKKRDIVQGTKELYSMLGNTEVLEDENILLRSDKYLQLVCSVISVLFLTVSQVASHLAISETRCTILTLSN